MKIAKKIRLSKLTSVMCILVIAFGGFTDVFGQKKSKVISTQPTKNKLTPKQIVDKVMPSLVVVFAQDKQGKVIGQGSGFVFKPGLIATNLHVFKRASNAFVKVPNKERKFDVISVVNLDIRRDICVVKIDDLTIPPLVPDETQKLSIGDEIFAFGNPKGLEGSVSKGIVSSIRSDIDLIQIDAAISPGSSGGPIVNDQGKVIGIAVATLTGGQNLNFSIPIKHLFKLNEKFNFNLWVAGILAVNDLENEKLKGPVKGFNQKFAYINYDESTDKYIEETSKKMLVSKSFDKFGHIIEEKTYHDGKFAWKYTYLYNDIGFWAKRSYEDYEGKQDSWEDSIEKFIDLKGRYVNLSGNFSNSVYNNQRTSSYDNSGNLIEETYQSTSDTEQSRRTIYAYNESGFEIESKEFLNNKLSKVRRYTYEVDRYGNWTKRLLTIFDSQFPSISFVPNLVVYREITYFE